MSIQSRCTGFYDSTMHWLYYCEIYWQVYVSFHNSASAHGASFRTRYTLHDCTTCMAMSQCHIVHVQWLYYCEIYWQVSVSFRNSVLPGQAALDSSFTLHRGGQLHSNSNALMFLIDSLTFRSLSFIDRFALRWKIISWQTCSEGLWVDCRRVYWATWRQSHGDKVLFLT